MKMLRHLISQEMEIIHDNSNNKRLQTYNTRLKYEIWAEPEQNQESYNAWNVLLKIGNKNR